MSSVYRASTNSNTTVTGLFDDSMVAHLVTLLSAIDKDGGKRVVKGLLVRFTLSLLGFGGPTPY